MDIKSRVNHLRIKFHSRRMCGGCSQAQKQFEHGLAKLSLRRFAEIESFASFGCNTCRLFRQALLRACFSKEEVAELQSATGPVFISKNQDTSRDFSLVLQVNLSKPELSKPRTLRAVISPEEFGSSRWIINANSNSETVFKTASNWLCICTGTHTQCTTLMSSFNGPVFNPTRLLDLGNAEAPRIRLMITESNTRLSYCALSYCWGGNKAKIETTATNLENHMTGIPLEKLGQTLRDAVTVAWRLRFRYLWIDALCVIQEGDDEEDFRKEAATMHVVYGNALLTLSVCSSKSSGEGFLGQRRAEEFLVDMTYFAGEYFKNSHHELEYIRKRSPLMLRGWTFQEELLSPRILYWSEHGIYWSCSIGISSECSSEHIGGRYRYSGRTPTQPFLLSVRRGTLSLRHFWMDAVEYYSARNFTHVTDRFPALSGIASLCQDYTRDGDTYLAGLWKSTLATDLLWTISGTPNERGATQANLIGTPDYVAPS